MRCMFNDKNVFLNNITLLTLAAVAFPCIKNDMETLVTPQQCIMGRFKISNGTNSQIWISVYHAPSHFKDAQQQTTTLFCSKNTVYIKTMSNTLYQTLNLGPDFQVSTGTICFLMWCYKNLYSKTHYVVYNVYVSPHCQVVYELSNSFI